MGIFDGIGDLTTSNKGEYLDAGDYLIEVQAVKLINSLRSADEFFIVDINAAFVDQALANDGESLIGLKCRVSVHLKPTNNGGVFSVHTWRAPVTDDVPF